MGNFSSKHAARKAQKQQQKAQEPHTSENTDELDALSFTLRASYFAYLSSLSVEGLAEAKRTEKTMLLLLDLLHETHLILHGQLPPSSHPPERVFVSTAITRLNRALYTLDKCNLAAQNLATIARQGRELLVGGDPQQEALVREQAARAAAEFDRYFDEEGRCKLIDREGVEKILERARMVKEKVKEAAEQAVKGKDA